MDAIEKSILEAMEDAKRLRCWRVACARIRDLAMHRQSRYGVPYNKTLIDLDYDYYRTKYKRIF